MAIPQPLSLLVQKLEEQVKDLTPLTTVLPILKEKIELLLPLQSTVITEMGSLIRELQPIKDTVVAVQECVTTLTTTLRNQSDVEHKSPRNHSSLDNTVRTYVEKSNSKTTDHAPPVGEFLPPRRKDSYDSHERPASKQPIKRKRSHSEGDRSSKKSKASASLPSPVSSPESKLIIKVNKKDGTASATLIEHPLQILAQESLGQAGGDHEEVTHTKHKKHKKKRKHRKDSTETDGKSPDKTGGEEFEHAEKHHHGSCQLDEPQSLPDDIQKNRNPQIPLDDKSNLCSTDNSDHADRIVKQGKKHKKKHRHKEKVDELNMDKTSAQKDSDRNNEYDFQAKSDENLQGKVSPKLSLEVKKDTGPLLETEPSFTIESKNIAESIAQPKDIGLHPSKSPIYLDIPDHSSSQVKCRRSPRKSPSSLAHAALSLDSAKRKSRGKRDATVKRKSSVTPSVSSMESVDQNQNDEQKLSNIHNLEKVEGLTSTPDVELTNRCVDKAMQEITDQMNDKNSTHGSPLQPQIISNRKSKGKRGRGRTPTRARAHGNFSTISTDQPIEEINTSNIEDPKTNKTGDTTDITEIRKTELNGNDKNVTSEVKFEVPHDEKSENVADTIVKFEPQSEIIKENAGIEERYEQIGMVQLKKAECTGCENNYDEIENVQLKKKDKKSKISKEKNIDQMVHHSEVNNSQMETNEVKPGAISTDAHTVKSSRKKKKTAETFREKVSHCKENKESSILEDNHVDPDIETTKDTACKKCKNRNKISGSSSEIVSYGVETKEITQVGPDTNSTDAHAAKKQKKTTGIRKSTLCIDTKSKFIKQHSDGDTQGQESVRSEEFVIDHQSSSEEKYHGRKHHKQKNRLQKVEGESLGSENYSLNETGMNIACKSFTLLKDKTFKEPEVKDSETTENYPETGQGKESCDAESCDISMKDKKEKDNSKTTSKAESASCFKELRVSINKSPAKLGEEYLHLTPESAKEKLEFDEDSDCNAKNICGTVKPNRKSKCKRGKKPQKRSMEQQEDGKFEDIPEKQGGKKYLDNAAFDCADLDVGTTLHNISFSSLASDSQKLIIDTQSSDNCPSENIELSTFDLNVSDVTSPEDFDCLTAEEDGSMYNIPGSDRRDSVGHESVCSGSSLDCLIFARNDKEMSQISPGIVSHSPGKVQVPLKSTVSDKISSSSVNTLQIPKSEPQIADNASHLQASPTGERGAENIGFSQNNWVEQNPEHRFSEFGPLSIATPEHQNEGKYQPKGPANLEHQSRNSEKHFDYKGEMHNTLQNQPSTSPQMLNDRGIPKKLFNEPKIIPLSPVDRDTRLQDPRITKLNDSSHNRVESPELLNWSSEPVPMYSHLSPFNQANNLPFVPQGQPGNYMNPAPPPYNPAYLGYQPQTFHRQHYAHMQGIDPPGPGPNLPPALSDLFGVPKTANRNLLSHEASSILTQVLPESGEMSNASHVQQNSSHFAMSAESQLPSEFQNIFHPHHAQSNGRHVGPSDTHRQEMSQRSELPQLFTNLLDTCRGQRSQSPIMNKIMDSANLLKPAVSSQDFMINTNPSSANPIMQESFAGEHRMSRIKNSEMNVMLDERIVKEKKQEEVCAKDDMCQDMPVLEKEVIESHIEPGKDPMYDDISEPKDTLSEADDLTAPDLTESRVNELYDGQSVKTKNYDARKAALQRLESQDLDSQPSTIQIRLNKIAEEKTEVEKLIKNQRELEEKLREISKKKKNKKDVHISDIERLIAYQKVAPYKI